jgi:proline dehydrogenase
MLRAILLYLSHAAWARNIMMHWPLARRVALRFVAGETQQQAIDTVIELNKKGMLVTLDVLGEAIHDAAQAVEMKEAYLNLLDALCIKKLNAWISLKLTALGIDVDAALCRDNIQQILVKARECNAHVTIDMEDHPYTQKTLDLFRTLKDDDGFLNVRTVIQSYLYRSDDDIEALAQEGAGIRLCKGAYKEPAHIAYPQKADVDAAYKRQLKMLLDAANEERGYPGIATHDQVLIEVAKRYAAEQNIPPDAYEFQMLYGVRSALQEQLVVQGYQVRVYIPFGTQWYPYFVRRLAERPANVWFFVSNFFRR